MAAKVKKGTYYVQYLGWKECKGIWGKEFTEPIVKDMVARRQLEDLPKLTIEVNKKDLRIIQLVPIDKKKGKIDKVKYPPIPAKDVTYAVQATSPDEDVIACIYLGFNPQTQCAVHVHVYRCDSPHTCAVFVDHLNQIIELPEHKSRVKRIEEELVAKEQILRRPSDNYKVSSLTKYMASEDYTYESSDDDTIDMVTVDSDMKSEVSDAFLGPFDRDVEYERPAVKDLHHMDSLAAELKNKLAMREAGPLLLPPADYDTVRRKHGNLEGIDSRRCKNRAIIGVGERGYTEDSAVGESEEGSPRNSADKYDLYRQEGAQRRSRPEGQRRSGELSDDSLQPVSPRWKQSQTYVPPPGGMGVMGPLHNGPRSPDTRRPPQQILRIPDQRSRSPHPMMHPRSGSPSPPPQHRGSRNRGSGSPEDRGRRAASPHPFLSSQSPALPRQNHRETIYPPSPQPQDRLSDPYYGALQGKKYTAATLGLLDRGIERHAVEPSKKDKKKDKKDKKDKKQKKGKEKDEGYRSMDQREFPMFDPVPNYGPRHYGGGGYPGDEELSASMPSLNPNYDIPPDYTITGAHLNRAGSMLYQ